MFSLTTLNVMSKRRNKYEVPLDSDRWIRYALIISVIRKT